MNIQKLDVKKIRQDFPILKRTVHGKPLVYLDNAATSQKPEAVVLAIADYYRKYNSNIHRGIHVLSEEATTAFEGVRSKVAQFIRAPGPETIVFTRNATEAVNLVAQGWGRKFVKPGDEILLTEMEHHANLVPWQILAQTQGAKLRFIPINAEGHLVLEKLDQMLTPKTRLVTLTMMSNVLGTINPVRTIIEAAHAHKIPVFLDGAQSVPHLPTDVHALDCDFLAFSAHKMLGPTGVGVLYGKNSILQTMEPMLGGGDMIREVWLDRSTWNDVPWRFEAGTPNIADVIGFGAALDYLTNLGMENVRAHEIELTAYALKALRQMDGITLYGPNDPANRGGVISFNLSDIHAHDVGQWLDDEGVAVRAGHHCCQPLMRKLSVAATARASFYIYNLPEEVDALMSALHKVKEVMKGMKGVSH